MRPREIQARIRAGASVEQVATAAGVPEQKIERFAYPVMLERFRTADNAQRAHPMRADGPDSRTLGDVVAHTFGLRGQAYEGVKWDSWKGEDGRWVVALSWRAGRSDNRAHWIFQPGAHGGTVTALDEHASDLVEGLPARPLRTVGAVVDMTRPEEEPPPAPSPVEQWRAAASDSYREQRLPIPPDTGRRTPSEPWRPAPPQRQPEPPAAYRPADPSTDARPEREPYRQAEPLADPRPADYRFDPLADPRPAGRPDGYRPGEPLADPRPARPGSYQPGEHPTGYRPADARPPAARPDAAGPAQPPERRGGSRASAEWAPWERGVTRTAPAPSVPAVDVTVPAARTATPTIPSATEQVTVDTEAPAAGSQEAPAESQPVAPAAPPEVVTTRGTTQGTDEAAEAEPSTAEPSATGLPETGPGAEPFAAEPSTAEGSGTESPETGPGAEPSTAEPSGTGSSKTGHSTEPSATEPSTAEPSAAERSGTGSSGAEPSGTGSSGAEPSAAEPKATDETTAASATTDAEPAEPATAEPAPAEPAVAEMPAGARVPAGASAKRTRKGKPVMPSWDEVLLGVRKPR